MNLSANCPGAGAIRKIYPIIELFKPFGAIFIFTPLLEPSGTIEFAVSVK
jgi:hypothetical protein